MITVSNVCTDCHGELREPDGTFYTVMLDDHNGARAADVCRICKLYHYALGEGDMSRDPFAALERLRKKGNGINYAVCCWVKTVEKNGRLIDRRYVVNLDGTISTRLDKCDLKRTAASYVTDGWQTYKPKQRIRNAEHAIRVCMDALEPQGYRREF